MADSETKQQLWDAKISSENLKQHERLDTLDALRGLASLAVAWFHFTNGNPAFLHNGILKYSGRYGWAGVEVFFVISGFIIPYALYRSHYRLKKYPIFVIKRILRLHPPYLVAIVIILFLNYFSTLVPGYKGAVFSISWKQLLLHFGYLNVFTGQDWLNPAFWTLAIEFQYYLFIGLIFPLIVSKNHFVRWAIIIILGVLPLILSQRAFFPTYSLLFLMGILTFYQKTKLLDNKMFFGFLFLVMCGEYFSQGALITVVGVSSALTIAFVQIENRMLKFLGDISYSLYLLHIPIGGRIINFSLRFKDDIENLYIQILVLGLATAASIIAAYCLYRLVEKTAQRWSSAIPYTQQTPFAIGV